MFVRHPSNPLITPTSVQPSQADFEVIGTFNAGITQYNGEVVMLLRVAERPINADSGVILCPSINAQGDVIITSIRRNDPAYNVTDPRMVRHVSSGKMWLTSMSHLRLARSEDGVTFSIAPEAWLKPQFPYESYGMEDARIMFMEDENLYYVNYTAVSPHGIATSLVTTANFADIERRGIIFLPSNRDVVFFPRKINGLYAAYHRPMPAYASQYNMWFATSSDGAHWGDYTLLFEGGDGWDGGRVGGGAPPVWTEQGWLSVYHAADKQDRYCLGAFLTPHDAPQRIIARSPQPVFEPSAPYEREGFYGNVVFTCGLLLQGNQLKMYYGAADECMALAEATIPDILASLIPSIS